MSFLLYIQSNAVGGGTTAHPLARMCKMCETACRPRRLERAVVQAAVQEGVPQVAPPYVLICLTNVSNDRDVVYKTHMYSFKPS